METCRKGHEHHERIIDNIGSILVEHGERDECDACLCGFYDYMLCPAKLAGWVEPWLTTTFTLADITDSQGEPS